MRRLLVVTNIPTPYRVPLFNTLVGVLSRAGWTLEVVFGSMGNERRLWEIPDSDLAFAYHCLNGRNLRLGPERIANTYRGLTHLLRDRRPDGIVCTGYSLGTVAALRHARRARIPLAIWSGTIAGGPDGGWWRRRVRSWLVRRSHGFLAYGTAARDYLVGLGAPADRIRLAWNTVDTRRFESLPGAAARAPGEPLRLLSVGHLEARKRVDLALRAVAAAVRQGLDVVLDIAGDGSQRQALVALAADLGIADRVRFLGYQQYGALEECYRRAHVLVFSTSYDIWGLVVAEAMAAGLVCLSSTRAGATRDLVVERETGFALDFEDTERVALRIAELCAARVRVEEMGREARRRIKDHFTLQHSSAGWVELISQW
jgi:glycosyltransferase involved in cell wall biosynthesis